MQIQQKRIKDAVYLSLNCGRASLDEAILLKNSLMDLMNGGVNKFVLDCRAIVSMDYEFVRVLILLSRRTILLGGDLKLIRSKYSPVWTDPKLKINQLFKVITDYNEAIGDY